MASFIAGPGARIYTASKFAVRGLCPRGVVRDVVAVLLERCAVDGVDVPLRIGRRVDLDVFATELDQPIDDVYPLRRATSRMKSSEVVWAPVECSVCQ
jgi:hypothetical protein